MVVEGVNTVQAACQLAEKYHVSMPITQSIYAVLFAGEKCGGCRSGADDKGQQGRISIRGFCRLLYTKFT